ncbi:hypothetical protein [Micrococcoides hystricis]|uniref:Uncharacterized protein n=1 Tax=Micrococcoides hystricis TaxID=1572761 RepID=A0ABV6PCM7_9MICC
MSDFPDGYVLDLSSLGPHDEPNIEAVEAYLAGDANRGVCVIADATTKLSQWRSSANRVTAELPDLLLEQQEAEQFYASLRQSTAQTTFSEAWNNVGGWLSGLFAAHRYGVDTAGVLDVMTWALHNADTYTGTLRDDRLAAFLTDYSENLLKVYYSSLVLNPPTLDSLSKSGLLVHNGSSWVMPIAIRQALKQHFWDSGGDESELIAFLLRAIARTKDVGTALEYGARQGDWDAVGQFLDEYWVELYTKEPEALLGVDGPFPEKLVQRFGDGNLSLRILTGALDGNPEAWRVNPMPHDENPTVRRLRYLVSRSPEPATAQTLTMNLLLLTYLRFSRYYAEAVVQA